MRNKRFSIKGIITLSMILVLLLPTTLHAENAQSLNHVRGVRKAGTYFIELAVDDKEIPTTKKYRVHIRFPKTVLNYEKEEGIDAHDLVYAPNTFDPNDVANIIKQGGAHAWSMNTGLPIDKVNLTVNDSTPRTGAIHTVTYMTDQNTAVTVNVFEQEEQYMNLDEIYMDQETVITNRFRTLSGIVIMITLFPLILFLILFALLSKQTKKTELLLK